MSLHFASDQILQGRKSLKIENRKGGGAGGVLTHSELVLLSHWCVWDMTGPFVFLEVIGGALHLFVFTNTNRFNRREGPT